MEKKLPKVCLSCHNLLVAQDLCQVHYQILSRVFLKEFIELNVNLDTDKKREIFEIKHKYYDCFLEYRNYKDDLIEYKCLCCNKNYQHRCLCCNKNYQHKFDEKFKEQCFKTYTFSKHDSNKFILLL